MHIFLYCFRLATGPPLRSIRKVASITVITGIVASPDVFALGRTGIGGEFGIMRATGARATRAAEGLPRRRFTVAEVEAMVEAGVMEEDERVELIGGELVPMSPKGNQHEV